MLRTGQDFRCRGVFREFPDGEREQHGSEAITCEQSGRKRRRVTRTGIPPLQGSLLIRIQCGRQGRETGNTGNRSGIAEKFISSSDRVICQKAFLFSEEIFSGFYIPGCIGHP